MKQRASHYLLMVALVVNLYVGYHHFTASAEAAGANDVYAHMAKFSPGHRAGAAQLRG